MTKTMADIFKRKRLMATWWLLSAFICAFAQGTELYDRKSSSVSELGVREHTWLVGGGFSNVLDSYLSPYIYKGGELRLMRETHRLTRMFWKENGNEQSDGNQFSSSSTGSEPRVTFQTLLDLHGAYLDSRAGNVNGWAGGVRYGLGWLYRLTPQKHVGSASDDWTSTRSQRFSLAVGPMLSGYLGAVYNERNGNNPAQAKLDLMLDLSAACSYRFRLFRHPFVLRYQLTIPFVGVAFSPNYGQSYYEAFSFGNYDRNAVFANFVNMPSMRHLLTLDVPISRRSRTALRVGYAGEFMQSTFNKINYHSYSHCVMIGFTQSFRKL